MERPNASSTFFHAQPWAAKAQGGCLEAGTVSLCVHFSFQTGHLGRQEPPSASRLCFPGAAPPAHVGLCLGITA